MSSVDSKSGDKRGNPASDDELSPRKAAKLTHFVDVDLEAEDPVPPTEDRQVDEDDRPRNWTIKIVHDGKTTKAKIYHVHTCMLVRGMRKSEYFIRCIQNHPEGQEGKCVIRLHPLAAAAFPALLNYIYMSDEALKINTETAAALHHLGKYLGMPQLRWDAKQFWKKDITSIDNLITYYEHAMIFDDEQIVDAVAEEIAKRVSHGVFIHEASHLAKTADPLFWSKVLHLVDGTDKDVSRLMSTLIGENLACHLESMDDDILGKLTASDRLPVVSHSAAVNLMKVYGSLAAANEKGIEYECPNLVDRCTTAMAWHSEGLQESYGSALQQRGPEFVSRVVKQIPFVVARELASLRVRLHEQLVGMKGALQSWKRSQELLAGWYFQRLRACPIKMWLAEASKWCQESTSSLFIPARSKRTSTASRNEGYGTIEVSDVL